MAPEPRQETDNEDSENPVPAKSTEAYAGFTFTFLDGVQPAARP